MTRLTGLITFITLTTALFLNPVKAQEKADTKAPANFYMPRIDGAVKAKVELSLQDGEYRFNVRNSRFGVAGNITNEMFYRIQVDFNNEGKVSILDSYVGYKIAGFDFRLGQQQYHFSTDLDRGPSTNMFANRSFLSKFLTSYYGSDLSGGKKQEFVKTLGSRDLGAMATYSNRLGAPIKLYFGVFNGSGSNNPEWGNTANLVGRIEYGNPIQGFRGALSYYNGTAPTHNIVTELNGELVSNTFKQRMEMLGAELRYATGNFFIEGEYARRYLENLHGKNHTLVAALVHTYYKFPFKNSRLAEYVSPILRWDIGQNVDFLNLQSKQRDTFDANRITAGINFGFGKGAIKSEVRLNYEKYLLKTTPSDFAVNKLLHDKVTFEVVVAF